jgi:hypothetical protein
VQLVRWLTVAVNALLVALMVLIVANTRLIGASSLVVVCVVLVVGVTSIAALVPRTMGAAVFWGVLLINGLALASFVAYFFVLPDARPVALVFGSPLLLNMAAIEQLRRARD